MEENITLSEILAAIVRSWKMVCSLALIFALLLGGYQGYKQYGLANAPENSPEKIEERYKTALENYEVRKKNLQKTLEKQEKSLASKEEYLGKSILFEIDPYNKYIANIVFTFSDIDDSAQLFRYPNTAADYLPKKIRSQYFELWKSMDVPKDIGLAKYSNMEWKYLSEIVSVTSLEGELVSIQAFGVTASDAEELVGAIFSYFDAHRDVIAAGSAQHSFTLVNQTTKTVIDEGLSTKRENLEKEIEDLKTTIEKTKQSIEDLTEPTREEGYSTTVIIKAVVKYAVLGAVLGLFAACAYICCLCVFGSKAASSYQVAHMSTLPYLGSGTVPDRMERLANRIVGERIWKDQESAISYVVEQIKILIPAGSQILILSTLPESKAGKAFTALQSVIASAGYGIHTVYDAAHSSETAKEIWQHDKILLGEAVKNSSLIEIKSILDQTQRSGKKASGFFMV